MIKKSLHAIFGLSALALLVVAAPAFAAEADVTAANEQTGADSVNTNTTTLDNAGDVTVTNDGDVDNDMNADVDTGDNEQNMNTTGGDLESGMVDASADLEAVVNEGFGLCGCPFGGDEDQDVRADFLNRLTGYDSRNINTLDVDNNGDVRVRNTADILNRLSLDADTGDNEQNMNTTAGDLTSGDVTAEFGISNWANTSEGSSSNGGSTSVDVTAENDTTGAESTNRNTVRVNNASEKRLTNRADIRNRINVDADTGDNEQNKNTTAGSLTSGSVDVETDIVNVANTGECCPSGGNNSSVSADLSNDTTGYDSTNENRVTVNNSGDKTVTNNADVDNDLNVDADTGDNEQNQNTSGGDVTSGDVSVSFTSTTVVNSSN